MVKGILHGLREDNMKENTSRIRSKDMEFSHGQMEKNTKVNGEMENSMEKER